MFTLHAHRGGFNGCNGFWSPIQSGYSIKRLLLCDVNDDSLEQPDSFDDLLSKWSKHCKKECGSPVMFILVTRNGRTSLTEACEAGLVVMRCRW